MRRSWFSAAAQSNSTFIFPASPYQFAFLMNDPAAPASGAPKPPIGRVFKVAAGCLLAFLIVQVLVASVRLLPGLQQSVVGLLTQAPKDSAAPQSTETPTVAPQQQAAPAEQPSVDEALVSRVKELASDSDKAFRIGDFDLGFSKIQEAVKLVPSDPGILLRVARLQEKMDKPAEAVATYKRVLELPGLSAELRAQTERKVATIKVPETPAAPTVEAAAQGADMRDEFGLQPGSSLGIVDTRLSDEAGGSRSLRIAIKSRPGARIDPRQMAVHVFFYDRDSAGNVQLTESQIQTEWISPPVNWTENEPELLNAIYTPPAASATAAEYAGYVVGIYYNNELQDTRADPGSLAREHPLPLYLQSAPQ